jgi:hypothetical protein
MRKDKSSCEANPTLPFLMPSLITFEFPSTLELNFYIVVFRDNGIVLPHYVVTGVELTAPFQNT